MERDCTGSKCYPVQFEDRDSLYELSRLRNRTLDELLRHTRYSQDTFSEKAEEFRKKRMEEISRRRTQYEDLLRQREEELAREIMDRILKGESENEALERILKDEKRSQLEREIRKLKYQSQGLSVEDLKEALKEFMEKGDIEIEGERVKITPRGARKLANKVLRRILENLATRDHGTHSAEIFGYGTDLSINSRRYEIGDEYYRVDFEKTLLNALERERAKGKISLMINDFQVYEEIHETRLVSGLIIDESGSMAGEKINAAIDTSLALGELIRREPKDVLKVFLFSEKVREISFHEILNTSIGGGSTDIRAALRAFRKAIQNERGDKQAYLITDTEPNTEDGRYVGFRKAATGVIQEALFYRQAGITLNIIMLDETPDLKELASLLAKKNLGRVFFTTPTNLGSIVIEDYLQRRKKSFRTA